MLMMLVMRKLLASSTFAIAGALDSLARKLQTVLRDDDAPGRSREPGSKRSSKATSRPCRRSRRSGTTTTPSADEPATALTEEQRAAIATEIAELERFRDLAVSITENAKGLALLTALQTGFARPPHSERPTRP